MSAHRSQRTINDPPSSEFNPIENCWEMRMAMRIRVITRADLREKRKQEHGERGYRMEDERPIPVNGFCSFVAVGELPPSDGLSELVAQALNGSHGARGDW